MRKTRLSEIMPSLNPELRSLVENISRRDRELLPETVARLLGYRSRRRVDQLCDVHELEFVHRPTRRVLSSSVVSHLLARHGYSDIEVDLDNLSPVHV